jgi:predicted Zn-dependent protease
VVGLPVAQMYASLKKIGVSLLLVLCCVGIFGCATEYNVATNREDLMMYSTDKEVAIGDSFSKEMETEYMVIHDRDLNERLNRVGEKIVAVCDRKELLYRFRVIEDKKDPDIVNAVSLPGGYVYVFKKLLKMADTDDELAAVVGHEVGHIVARHSIKRIQAIWGYNILTVLAATTGSGALAQGTQVAYLSAISGYSQEDELLADKLGARYAKRAGYDPKAMLIFLNKLWEHDKKEKPQELNYFRSHPYTGQRIKSAREELGGRITFEDFLNVL